MATDALHSLWVEPRPTNPPNRGPRDWTLVAVLICWSVVEAVLGEDLAPRSLLLLAVLAVLGPLLWRRAHPLVAVAVSFGTWTIVDSVRIPFAMASAALPDLQARLRRAEDELAALKATPPPTRPSLGPSSGA